MHVSICIVTWNDGRYLPELFASIRAQTFTGYTVRILDNASVDGETVPYMVQNAPHWLVARSTKNIGTALARNQLIARAMQRTQGDAHDHAILFASPDTVWHPECVANLVHALEEHPEVSAVQPKIFRAFSERGDYDTDSVKSDILDSTGIRVCAGWRFEPRGAGEMDQGQYDGRTDIFGPSGAMMMIRASALHAVAYNDEIFDSALLAHGEEDDLAWRLRRQGDCTLFVPAAVVHHYRGLPRRSQPTWWQRMRDRRVQRPLFTALRTRNLVLIALKNLSVGEWIRSAPSLLRWEGWRVVRGMVLEPETRRVLLQAIPLLPSFVRKHRAMQRTAHVPFRELRKYQERS